MPQLQPQLLPDRQAEVEVLDAGGCTIERKDPARLPVEDKKRAFETAITFPKFIVSVLFRLDLLIDLPAC